MLNTRSSLFMMLYKSMYLKFNPLKYSVFILQIICFFFPSKSYSK